MCNIIAVFLEIRTYTCTYVPISFLTSRELNMKCAMHAFTSMIWMWFSRSLGFQISFKAAHIENKRCVCMFTEKIWQFKLLNCMRLSFSCKLVCVYVCVRVCVCSMCMCAYWLARDQPLWIYLCGNYEATYCTEKCVYLSVSMRPVPSLSCMHAWCVHTILYYDIIVGNFHGFHGYWLTAKN